MSYFTPETDPKIDFDKLDPLALAMLNNARDMAGMPFLITSHYRTPEHSVAVGGLNGDAHMEIPCGAFDIACDGGHECLRIVSGLIAAGFKRIGINSRNGHIHVDCSKNLPQEVMWVEQ